MSRTPSQQTTTALVSASGLPHHTQDAITTHSVEGNVRSIEMATDRTAWTAESDGGIRIRSLPSGTVVKMLERKGKTTFCNALLLVEGKMWAAYSDGFIRRYDAKTASLEREVVQHDGAVHCLHYAAGRVYSGGADWKVYQWNPSSCEYQRLFFGHSNSVRCLHSLSTPHGLLLFSGSDDGTIRAWDPHAPLQSTKDVACIHTFKNHTRSILALEGVPDRKQLWSGSEDHSIRVWNTDNFQCAAVLERHRAPVASLAFVYTRVWSGGKDGTLFLWDAKTLSPIQTLQEGIHVSPRYVMCIKRLYRAHYYKLWTSTSDGFIQCWNADTAHADTDGFELLTADEEVARKRDTARIEGLQAALYEHGAMLNDKEDEIKGLQYRMQVLKDPMQNPDLIALSDQCTLLTHDLEVSARQREQLTQQCAMADELLHVTRQKLKESTQSNKDLQVDRDRLAEQLSGATRTMSTLSGAAKENEQLQQEKATLEDVVRRQQAEAEALVATMGRLEDAVRSHQHLFAENARLRHEVESLEGLLAAERRHVENLKSRAGGGAPSPLTAAAGAGRSSRGSSAGPSPRSPGASIRPKRGSPGTAMVASHKRHDLDTTDEDEESSPRGEPSLIPTTDDEAPVPRSEPPSGTPRVVGGGDSVALQERLEDLRLENESIVQQCTMRQAAYDAEMAQMRQQLADASHALANLRQQAHAVDKDSEIAQVKAAHEKLKADSSKTIGELRATLKLAQADIASKVQQAEQAHKDQTVIADAHRRDVSKREKQLMDLRDGLAKAQAALESAKRDGDHQLAAAQVERDELRRQLTDARREKDRIERSLLDYTRQQVSTTSAENSADALRQKWIETQGELEQAERELRTLRAAESRHAIQLSLLQEKLEGAERNGDHQLAAVELERDELRRQLTDARREKDRVERALLDYTRQQVSTTSAENSADALRQKWIETQGELEQAHKELRTLRAAESRHASELSLLQEELREAKAEIASKSVMASPNRFSKSPGSTPRRGSAPAGAAPSSPTAASPMSDVSVALVQLRNENDALRVEKLHMDAAMRQVLLEVENARRASDTAAARIDELQRQRDAQGGALEEALEFLNSEKERFDALQQTYEAMSEGLQLAEHREAEHQQRAQELEAQVQRLKEDVGTLTSSLEAAIAEKRAVAAAADERRVRVPSPLLVSPSRVSEQGDGFYTPESGEAAQHVIEELEEALETKQRACDDALEQVAVMEERLAVVTDDLVKCIAQRRAADDTAAAQQVSLERERDESLRLQQDLSRTCDTVARLQRELANTKSVLEAAKADWSTQSASNNTRLQQLEQDLREAERRATAAADDAEKTRTALAALSQDRHAIALKFDEASRAARASDVLVENLQRSIGALETENEAFKKELVEAHCAHQEARTQSEDRLAELAAGERHALEQYRHCAATLDMREKQLERLSAELDAHRETSKRDLTGREERAMQLEQRLIDAESRLDESTTTTTHLKRALEDALQTHGSAINDMTRKHTTEMERRVREAQQNARADMSDLQQERAREAVGREKAERLLAETRAELDDVLVDRRDLQLKCATLEKDLQASLQQIHDVKAGNAEQLRTQQRDIDRLQELHQRAVGTLELRDKQLTGVQSDLATTKEALERLTHRYDVETLRINERLKERDATAAQLSVAHNEQKATLNGLRLELASLTTQFERERDAHEATSALLKSAHATVSKQSDALASLTHDCERLQHECAEWKSELQTTTAAYAVLAESLEQCKAARDDVLQAHNELSHDLGRQSLRVQQLEAQCAAHEQAQAVADADAAALKQLTEAHEAQREHLATAMADVVALRHQENHARVYAADLESTIQVMNGTIRERREELVSMQAETQALQDRIVVLEQQSAQHRHRISEADREHAELLRLREWSSEHAGAADAAYQEHKILVDQVAAAEDANADLEHKLQDANDRLVQLAGAEETIAALSASRERLSEELARVQSLLLAKTEEALEGIAAKDRADYHSAQIEGLMSDLHRCQQDNAAKVRQLEGVVRDQEDRLMSASTATERAVRDLTAAEARIGILLKDSDTVADLRQQLAQIQRELVSVKHDAQQTAEENAALKKRLAATGPLSQLEMESALSNLERLVSTQQDQLKQSEHAVEELQRAVQSDQAVLCLALSEARVPRDAEAWMREVADSKAKAQALEAALLLEQHAAASRAQTLNAWKVRVRMLEGMLFRQYNSGGQMPSGWATGAGAAAEVPPSRATSIPAAIRAEDASTGEGRFEPYHNCVDDDDHLVPTPQPTPRGVSMATSNGETAMSAHAPPYGSVQDGSTVNPILLRTYTEHLSSALQRSAEINEHLQRTVHQRSEGQRLLAERLGTIRTIMMHRGGGGGHEGGGGMLASLVDEANNHRVAALESNVLAYRRRWEALRREVASLKEDEALRVVRGDAHVAGLGDNTAAALDALQDALHTKATMLQEAIEERDVARYEAQQRAHTISCLVEHVVRTQQVPLRAADGDDPVLQLTVARQTIGELKAKIAGLHTVLAQIEHSDDASNDANTGGRLSEALELAEERMYLSEQLVARQAAELARTYSTLARTQEDLRAKQDAVDEAESKHSAGMARLDAANEGLADLHRIIEAQEQRLSQQASALTAQQHRRTELVAWVRGTPQLQLNAAGMSEHDMWDTLTVCRHLHRLYLNAQEDARRSAAKEANDVLNDAVAQKDNELASARDRIEQLVHDVRCALDDAEQWKERHDKSVQGRFDAVQRAAQAEAEMLALQASLESEKQQHIDAKAAVNELTAAARSKDELAESLHNRIAALECRLRDAQCDIELRDVELAAKQANIAALTRDLDAFNGVRKALDEQLREAVVRADDAEARCAVLAEDLHRQESSNQALSVKISAVEERYSADVSAAQASRERLESQLSALRQENLRIAELTQALRDATAKADHLEREERSLGKRLAIAHELNGHLKAQNDTLERNRTESTLLRSRLSTSAGDAAQLRRLCTDAFGILATDAEEKTVTGYVVLLEEHAQRLHDERVQLRNTQPLLEGLLADLSAARQASQSFAGGVAHDGADRTSLSLSPCASELVDSRSASRSTSPAPSLIPLVAPSDLHAWLERLSTVAKSVCVHHLHLVEAIRSTKAKMMSLADHNKRLSEEVDVLSNKLKQAAARIVRSENTEQLLSFIEPSRDVAVRTLFHLRDYVNDMRIHLSLLQGTVSQTKEHWLELHHQLTAELEPLKSLSLQAQTQLAHAFDKCLTPQEKEEVIGGGGGGLDAGSSGGATPATGTSEPTSRTQTPRQHPPAESVTRFTAAGTPVSQEPPFDGLRTLRPSTSYATPQHPTTSSAAIIGLGGESAANREVVARGIQEARRRGQMWSDRDA